MLWNQNRFNFCRCNRKSIELILTFEDKLNKFKTDSDEKMQDIKRNVESKRNGGYKRNSYF